MKLNKKNKKKIYKTVESEGYDMKTLTLDSNCDPAPTNTLDG